MMVRSRDFSVLHVNTRSMNAHNNTMKLDEINVRAAEYDFDVICLTETWLDNSIDANSIRLIGYRDLFHLDRNRHGGGVLAYVKNNMYVVRHFDFESPDVEILWLELKTINSCSQQLAVCYLPPNTTSFFRQTFIESMSIVIETLLVDPCCCILLVGDYHSVEKPVQLQTNLFRTFSAYGLQQLIDTPTRECKILDWVLTNIPFAVVSHGILDPISNLDHNPIFIKFDFSLQRCTASKPAIVWDYDKGNFPDLNNALYATTWEFIIMNSPNVDCTLLNITDVINQTLKTFIPTKIIYPSKRNKRWFNHELKTLIRKRT